MNRPGWTKWSAPKMSTENALGLSLTAPAEPPETIGIVSAAMPTALINRRILARIDVLLALSGLTARPGKRHLRPPAFLRESRSGASVSPGVLPERTLSGRRTSEPADVAW